MGKTRIEKAFEKIARSNKDSLNKMQGRFGELAFEQEMGIIGKKYTRTGVGSDYKVGNKLIEVKTGNAKLSKKQENMRRRHGNKKYEVRRYSLGGV